MPYFLRYFLGWCKKFHENPSKQYCETECLTAPSDAAWTLALGRVPFFRIATQIDNITKPEYSSWLVQNTTKGACLTFPLKYLKSVIFPYQNSKS